MLKKCLNTWTKKIKKNMASEQELNKTNPLHKEFQSLLEKTLKIEN